MATLKRAYIEQAREQCFDERDGWKLAEAHLRADEARQKAGALLTALVDLIAAAPPSSARTRAAQVVHRYSPGVLPPSRISPRSVSK